MRHAREVEEQTEARLVPFGAARPRAAALRVAARLARDGIPAMLVPALCRPGVFDVVVRRDAASAAVLSLAVDAGARGGAFRTAATIETDEDLPARTRRLAAFFALGLGFGLGHVYAREHLAGLILALGQASCLGLAALGIGEALWGFPALMAVDAWGARAAVDRENEGQRRDGAQQLAAALPAVALVVATATVLGPGLAERARSTATIVEAR